MKEGANIGDVIAIFDFEGTLCTGGWLLWWGIVKSQFKIRRKIAKAIFHTLRQTAIGLLYSAGFIDVLQMRLSYTADLAQLLKGLQVEQVTHLASEISGQLFTRLRPDLIGILQGHQQQGHKVILVSSAFEPFVEAMGQRLGTFLSIGTGLEERDGRYTGCLSGPVCFREERVHMLVDRLEKARLEVDLSLSYAYGDRIWDKPVLQMIGEPVAVYPDAKLRAHAERHGWRIIG